jgi:hypothetical protein
VTRRIETIVVESDWRRALETRLVAAMTEEVSALQPLRHVLNSALVDTDWGQEYRRKAGKIQKLRYGAPGINCAIWTLSASKDRRKRRDVLESG